MISEKLTVLSVWLSYLASCLFATQMFSCIFFGHPFQ